MKFIDLFSGIGGMRLGLEQAGHECVGFCEWDKYARQSYKAMYNMEGEWECRDIRTASPMELPKADLWCFGFPCQDISVAGKQKGLQAGERSGLFYEVMRLLAGRRKEDRPQWLLIENVKHLLSIGNGFDFARLLLEVGGYGYDVCWQILNSKDFGVPQNRERVFLVCRLGGFGGRKILPIAPADGENPCKLQEMTQKMCQSLRCYAPTGLSRYLSSEDGGRGTRTGLYAVKVKRPAETRPRVTKLGSKTDTAGAICAREHKGLADGSTVVIQQLPHGFNTGGEKDIAPTLTGSAYQHNNFVKGVYTNASKDFQRQPLENMSRTIKAEKHDAGIYDGVRIRRLTPRECWRLQGFPDEYFDKAQAAGVSDSQLYKQAGNAVTVNVARAIGRRLKEVENNG